MKKPLNCKPATPDRPGYCSTDSASTTPQRGRTFGELITNDSSPNAARLKMILAAEQAFMEICGSGELTDETADKSAGVAS